MSETCEDRLFTILKNIIWMPDFQTSDTYPWSFITQATFGWQPALKRIGREAAVMGIQDNCCLRHRV